LKFFVVCPRGLELPLYEEVKHIIQEHQKIEGPLQKALSSAHMGEVPTKPTGGIEISGGLELAMLMNLHSRIASRVLLQLIHTPYKKEEDIYSAAKKISWEDWFTTEQTLRVDVTAQKSTLNSINFITLRIKDAICDRFRDLSGKRPSIETATPDARVMAFLDSTYATIYMDTSGEALFKRGWRDEKGAAPLKENLAAGILAFTGWRPEQALFDPMCGSGTFIIEAAQIAKAIPPGAIRAGILTPPSQDEKPPVIQEPKQNKETEVIKPSPTPASAWVAPVAVETGQVIASPKNKPLPVLAKPPELKTSTTKSKFVAYKPSRVDLVTSIQGFGFLRLKPFLEQKMQQQWKLIKELAQERMQDSANKTLRIAGSDINEQMVSMTQRNWQKAGLPGLPIVRQIDALAAKSPFGDMKAPGVLLFNPPYGERIDIKGGRGDDAEKKSRGARDPLPKNISDPVFVEFLAQYGRHLKEHFEGWQVDVLTADMGLPGQLRMKETKRTPLFNGAIECRLFRFEIRPPVREKLDTPMSSNLEK
jgi:putative N6-adenine-specific DNA methylase